jgi:hypothetical protein
MENRQVNVRRPDPDKLRAMRVLLKAAFDCVTAEPVPQCINDTLRRLK